MVNDKDGKKMSKSKGNVVNPNEMVEKFGADAVRTYMMFAAPLEDDVIWNEDNIVGVRRFLEKVWNLKEKLSDEHNASFDKELHKTLRQVTEQMEELKFNTVVSDLMKLTNTATKEESIGKEQYRIMLQMLNPMAPHITEFLISEMSGQELLDSSWPKFDPELAIDDEKTIGVQVNGKRRGDISVSDDDTEDTAMEMARAVESINKFLNEGEIVKVIYVPGKILNIVVK
jgi:leucyl-tRNA synthetase